MATHIKLSLDTRRKDVPTFPLVFRLTHNRRTTSISTGIKLKKLEWDQKNSRIKNTYKGTGSITRLNKYKDVLWARSRFNKNLKKIGEMAGVEETLTSYVSRHSFATGADDLGVPLTAISQMLGHQKISTTEAYLAGLRTSKKDEYQDQVLKRFKENP